MPQEDSMQGVVYWKNGEWVFEKRGRVWLVHLDSPADLYVGRDENCSARAELVRTYSGQRAKVLEVIR
jgi:hypothetical protein